ncbi:Transcriptional activator spt7 [Thecaphora frezii]
MKYLLQAIEAKRSLIRLNDTDLRKLLTEVRKGRDEREEFLESIERILTELRNYSEHSAAFLSKVSKRDAPDYYDVIKHPMDLGTMQKKVKTGQYKSKKQFAHDLDLIWDNCLKYNSDPTHPLRRNVHFMRKKADHLLEFISDKSDVKEALIQWEANETARAAQNREGGGGAEATAAPPSYGFVSAGRMESPAAISLDKQGSRFSAVRKRQDPLSVPFEQRPAFVRTPESMSTFASLDRALLRAEATLAPALVTLPPPGDDNVGPSSRPMRTLINGHANGASVGVGAVANGVRVGGSSELDPDRACAALEGIRDRSSLDPLSATLGSLFRSNPLKGKERATPEKPQSSDPYKASACWWTACASDEMMAAGLPELPQYGRPGTAAAAAETATSPDQLPKRRKLRRLVPPTRRPGLQGKVARNIRTIQKVQETHGKFLSLAHVVESEAPISAYLTHISSDEESDDYPSAEEDGEPPDAHLHRYPLARISPESARDNAAWNAKHILAHHGFEGGHRAAVDVLTNVMIEFLMNIGRTLRIYADRYANKMSAEAMILHSLLESGNTNVVGLESYIRDDVERYGGKMSDLLRKLKQSYKEQLAQSTERGVLEDDALFADGSEALMSGNFAEELGDDFFGFREMGLDRELGISGLTVPSRLFHGRGPARMAAAAKGIVKEEVLPYPPPPPYVPLTSSAISAQIGLLQGWYRDKLRERRSMSKPTEVEEDAETWANTLPDEEQERQKYKVPPTGKLPSRTMWTPGWAQKALAKASAVEGEGGGGTGLAAGAAQGKPSGGGGGGTNKGGGAKRKRLGSTVG